MVLKSCFVFCWPIWMCYNFVYVLLLFLKIPLWYAQTIWCNIGRVLLLDQLLSRVNLGLSNFLGQTVPREINDDSTNLYDEPLRFVEHIAVFSSHFELIVRATSSIFVAIGTSSVFLGHWKKKKKKKFTGL